MVPPNSSPMWQFGPGPALGTCLKFEFQLTLTSHGNLGKFCNLHVPQFAHLQSGGDKGLVHMVHHLFSVLWCFPKKIMQMFTKLSLESNSA